MAMGSYLSIITLNVNGLNAPNKRQILAVWIQKPLYVLSTRDTPQTKGYILTETEGLEKDISCKWRTKESKSSSTHARQNRLQNKDRENILHNDQVINPRRRYNNK